MVIKMQIFKEEMLLFRMAGVTTNLHFCQAVFASEFISVDRTLVIREPFLAEKHEIKMWKFSDDVTMDFVVDTVFSPISEC